MSPLDVLSWMAVVLVGAFLVLLLVLFLIGIVETIRAFTQSWKRGREKKLYEGRAEK